MKRPLDSSDSLGALMTMCPTATEEHSPRNNNAVFQQSMMLEGLDEEESSHLMMTEKKRRLSVDQVKALEKNFEVENKLEPERKVKLAQELGLQPRQVAVWFQNRRARWKTKQLERDYGVLKASYDALKLNYDSVEQDNEALLKQIKELKSRMKEEETESDVSVKEETRVNETLEKVMMEPCETECKDLKDLNYECLNNGVGTASFMAADLKDGASDSDSSAILNEDNSCNVAVSSSGGLQSHGHHQFLVVSPVSSPLQFNCSSSSSPSSMNCFQFQKAYQSGQYVKMEEHNFFSTEETCDFFSEEQAPTLQWYCSDHWS